ncbi:MAG: tRNA1(Val) (adenine(37)-N6)-methyltransferase [Bacteroidetes bacterium ADurb.Bin408]|nr:MAG: tRNA1(Val) (adenine(37)-N6)-methyltransferase [Bacteroidetes bacterium ADurb.Bin408]
MPVFYFKQFSLNDDDCAMKIGTDAVLLGSWTQIKYEREILDIGTGCGILALMLAQKSTATVDAVEIDKNAAGRATINFQNTLWNNRLNVVNAAFNDFAESTTKVYDMAVCNPPFFSDSLLSGSHARNVARHNVNLSPEKLLCGVAKLLKPGGIFNLILPFDQEKMFRQWCTMYHFFPLLITRVIPVYGKTPNRTLFSLIKENNNFICIENELIIRMDSGKYSSDYTNLTKDFLLNS